MKYTDCHCHLSDNFFYRNIDQSLTKWGDMGVKQIVSMATNLKTAKRNLELASLESSIKIIPAIGRHPWGAHKVTTIEKEEFTKLITANKKSIIGEIGLDYHFVKEPEKQNQQKPLLNFFLELAIKLHKPIMLHTTGAEEDIVNCLTNYKIKSNICCHWFSGKKTILRKLIDLNCYFSINPAVLKSKSHRIVAEIVESDRLLTESDGPVKFNEQKSSPELIPLIITELAKIKAKSNIEMSEIINENLENYLNFA